MDFLLASCTIPFFNIDIIISVSIRQSIYL
jgi:hypothetical protein